MLEECINHFFYKYGQLHGIYKILYENGNVGDKIIYEIELFISKTTLDKNGIIIQS